MKDLFISFLIADSTSGSTSASDNVFPDDYFIRKLFPNGWSFLINFLALIVLFVAIYFIAYKPMKKYIDARKDYVEHNLRDSERAKAINEQKAAESDQIISDAKKEAGAIIVKAKADASTSANEIVVNAQIEAQARQKAADEAIKQEEEKSKRAIHDEIVNVALDASKQVLGREVNSKDNEKLVSDFTDSVKGDKKA
jgi:F-type H+-transporting ATPase subunit b